MRLPRRVSKAGPLIDYLLALLTNPDAAPKVKVAVDAIRAVLNSDDGAILMELLEKATHDYALDPMEDVRALSALNAQRFIALDLRRIASDEFDAVLEKAGVGAKRRGRGR